MIKSFPPSDISISVSSTACFLWAKERFKNIRIYYLPLDFMPCIFVFLNKLKPRLFVITEAEIWINLLFLLKFIKKSIIINAKISKKSFSFYKKFKKIYSSLLSNPSKIIPKSQKDKERFSFFNLKNLSDKVGYTKYGSITFLEIKELNINSYGKLILTFGSLRKGEFEIAKEIIKDTKEKFFFIIIPRHLREIKKIKKLFTPFENQILIVDKMGLSLSFYKISDCVIIGGSFVKGYGGHNINEPAALKKPTFFGKYIENFQEVALEIENQKAGGFIKDIKEFCNFLKTTKRQDLEEMGKKAYFVIKRFDDFRQWVKKEIYSLL